MTAAAIIASAIRTAVRAEARELGPSRQDQIADAALAALDPFMQALAEGSSRGFNRARAKPAAPVRIDPATQAACKPTTTAEEAGITEAQRS